ncbi:hypothetical protein ACGLHS_07280 [Variovorax sp. VaC1]|uniref:hypothetical protein n=1 Tax=Variovorax sp. VaC1 TaxID=3373132 RepID=UPI003748CC96
MRQFQLRQPQPLQQPVARPSAPAPARAAASEIDGALDKAAALWTTRRIRSFLMLLEQPTRAAQR